MARSCASLTSRSIPGRRRGGRPEISGGEKMGFASPWPNDSGPTFWLMPYSVTIAREISVARSRSFCAPVRSSNTAPRRCARPRPTPACPSARALLRGSGPRAAAPSSARARPPREGSSRRGARVQALAVVGHERVAHLVLGDAVLLLFVITRLLRSSPATAVDRLFQLLLVTESFSWRAARRAASLRCSRGRRR